MSDMVLVQDLGEASILRLNRADKANALNGALVDALHEAFERTIDAGRKLVVFAGVGRHFCSGFDFSGYQDQSEGDLLLRFVRIEEFLQRVRYAPCITAAFMRGVAFGAGADLVASCALRAGMSDSRFRFPGSRFGVVLGTRHLAKVIGGGRAREILSLNRTLNADEALANALLTELIPDEVEVEDFAQRLADEPANLEPGVIRQLNEQAAGGEEGYEDLGILVKSLSRPGLHGRIDKYLESAKAKR